MPKYRLKNLGPAQHSRITEGLEQTMLNYRLKHQGLEPTLLIDCLKMRGQERHCRLVESIFDDQCPALDLTQLKIISASVKDKI